MTHIISQAQGLHGQTARSHPSIPGAQIGPPRDTQSYARGPCCRGPTRHFLRLGHQVGRAAQGAARAIGQSWPRPGLAAQLLPTITQGVVFPRG